MVTQMIKTGEETGKLNFMLKTLGKALKKEVDNADTLVGLIEPVMIVVLSGWWAFFLFQSWDPSQYHWWDIGLGVIHISLFACVLIYLYNVNKQ